MTPQGVLYAEAYKELQDAMAGHSELIQAGAPAEMLLESRYALERSKARLQATRAAVTNAAWHRLEQAPNLGRAVDVLLAGILADARALINEEGAV